MGCGSSKKSTAIASRRTSHSSSSISNRLSNHSSALVRDNDEKDNGKPIDLYEGVHKRDGTHEIEALEFREKEDKEHDRLKNDDQDLINENENNYDKDVLSPELESEEKELDVREAETKVETDENGRNELFENKEKERKEENVEEKELDVKEAETKAETDELEKNEFSERVEEERKEEDVEEKNLMNENEKSFEKEVVSPELENEQKEIDKKETEAETDEKEKNKLSENIEEEVDTRPHENTNLSELIDRETSAIVNEKENAFEIDDGYDDNYTPFDEEEDDCIIDGYEKNAFGLMFKTLDYRSYQRDEEDERPIVEPGDLYTDRDFPLEIAIVQDTSAIEWKRPGEFLPDPVLFHEETTRFDIGQGSAGTCWFLSTVATMADKDDMISQVIPKDAYSISNSETYDGMFHARFFHFGKWIDIYIDDYIPVLYGNVPWGAKSSTHENEIWVSLLEKAFARLHGSYNAIYGGQPGDAYLQLTGGIGERVDLDDHENSQDELYDRLNNALKTGSQVTCVVPDEYDNHKGLVGGHAYSLVGTTKINNTKLVRVRNPWGRGEWKGRWSDESEEWKQIVSSGATVPKEDDGEFFVCLEDFMKYFSQTTICSLTPDFDCDGVSDPMNFVLNIFGEWTDGKMGGFHDVLQNPRFSFSVTEEGMLKDGKIPCVIQIVQHTQKRKTGNVSMRCNLYRIVGQKLKSVGRMMAIEIQGKKNNVYTTEMQATFRYKLKPGRYMAIPSTCEGGVQKAFLLRIYTPAPLQNIKEVPSDANILSCENEETLKHGSITHELTFEKMLFGAFISGVNAGGQVSHRESYSGNPQYLISIPNTGSEVPLVVHIMQTQVEPQYPVGFRIFELDNGVNPPVTVDYLYDKYNESPEDIEGSRSKFMISWDVDIRYLLPPGRYIGLVHLDQPDTEKSFAILFKSNTNIGIKGMQTGE